MVEADRVWKLQWHTGPKKQPLDAEDKDILPRNLKRRIDRREIYEHEVRERSSSKKHRVVKRVTATQTGSTWGLGTVSHRAMNYFTYLYDTLAGTQTWAYVIDTGVRTTHSEFEGRATLVWTGFAGLYNDTSGHGTHVAGTIAGKTYGVSKKTNVLAVKIFNGEDTTTSIVLAGYQWAVNDIINKRRNEWAVINMSIQGKHASAQLGGHVLTLQGPYSAAFNNAIETAWKNNKVVSVVAAGNYGVNANTMSPSSSPSAITVGAIDSTWTMPSWSNYGSTVDILAPGVGVTSAWNTNDTSTNTIDGTSMACPHVSGLVLYAYTVPGIWAVDLPAYLKRVATPNKASNLRGSPNLVANNANKQQPSKR